MTTRSRSVERLANELVDLRKRMRGLESAPRLIYTSIDNGNVKEYDGNGKLVSIIGKQYDGTHVHNPVNGPKPPRPSKPVLIPQVGGIEVRWDGTFVPNEVVVDPDAPAEEPVDDVGFDTEGEAAAATSETPLVAPLDFTRVEVHVGATADFVPNTFDTLLTSIESPRGGSVFPRFFDEVPRWFRLVTRTLPGGISDPSEAEQATPLPIGQENLGFDLGEYAGARIYYGDEAPEGVAENDIWVKTPDNIFHRWTGTAWEEIRDAGIIQALQDSLLAQQAAAAAEVAATGALAAANGKNRNFYQPEPPSVEGRTENDLWFDTNNGYKMHVFQAGAWVPSVFGSAAFDAVYAGTIDAGQIVSGTIDALRIGANSITTRHLVIGSFDNLITDPNFLSATFAVGPHEQVASSADYFATTAARTGGQVLRIQPSNNATQLAVRLNGRGGHTALISSTEGDRLYGEIYVRAAAAGAQNVELRWYFYNLTGAAISSTTASVAVAPTATGWSRATATSPAAPAGTAFAALGIVLLGNNTTTPATYPSTALYFQGAYARRMVDGQIIVDGGISARKIATGVLTAGQQIIAGGHDVNGNILSTAGRVTFDDNGIKLIQRTNGVDDVRVHLNTGTGSGYFYGEIRATTGELSGTLTVTGRIFGGLVEGAAFKTTVNGTDFWIANSGYLSSSGAPYNDSPVLAWRRDGWSGSPSIRVTPGGIMAINGLGGSYIGVGSGLVNIDSKIYATAANVGVVAGQAFYFDMTTSGGTRGLRRRTTTELETFGFGAFYINGGSLYASAVYDQGYRVYSPANPPAGSSQRAMAVGNTVVSTDSLGRFSIYHGFGYTPLGASLTAGSAWGLIATLNGVSYSGGMDANYVYGQVRDENGTNRANASVRITYIIVGY